MTIKQLSLSFLAMFIMLSCNQIGNVFNSNSLVENIDVEKFIELSKDSNTFQLDVRTDAEISEGYIPETQLFFNVNDSEFETKIMSLDTNKTYLVYCRSGSRSSRACSIMEAKGFKKLYNLNGGIGAWSGNLSKDR